jgi:hypothetical protein
MATISGSSALVWNSSERTNDDAADCEAETDHQADRRNAAHLPEHHAANRCQRRAQRQPHRELAPPFGDGAVHRHADAEQRQQQRDRAEDGDGPCGEARQPQRLIDPLVEREHQGRQIRIDAPHDAPDFTHDRGQVSLGPADRGDRREIAFAPQ